MIIAIDYDNTITEYRPYPQEAPVRKNALSVIEELYNRGHTLILWTSRQEPYYTECLQRLKKLGIYNFFKWEYENSPCGKIEADLYIDDKGYMTESDVNWNNILKYVIQKEYQN